MASNKKRFLPKEKTYVYDLQIHHHDPEAPVFRGRATPHKAGDHFNVIVTLGRWRFFMIAFVRSSKL